MECKVRCALFLQLEEIHVLEGLGPDPEHQKNPTSESFDELVTLRDPLLDSYVKQHHISRISSLEICQILAREY